MHQMQRYFEDTIHMNRLCTKYYYSPYTHRTMLNAIVFLFIAIVVCLFVPPLSYGMRYLSLIRPGGFRSFHVTF